MKIHLFRAAEVFWLGFGAAAAETGSFGDFF